MMKPNRPHISKGGAYPPEFREEAVRYWVRYWLSSGQTLKQVASDLGVSPECLRLWRRQIGRRQIESVDSSVDPAAMAPDETGLPVHTSSNHGELALARELGQLRRELEAMTRQRTF
jgi:transposase-like protein